MGRRRQSEISRFLQSFNAISPHSQAIYLTQEAVRVLRERLLRAIQSVAVYLFWPAIILVAWGELSKSQDAVALEGLFWDKSLHFMAYFGLSGMICLILKESRRVLAAAVSLVLFAGALEILQGYFGRDPDIYDEVANTLGVITGAAVGYLVIWLLTPKAVGPAKPH